MCAIRPLPGAGSAAASSIHKPTLTDDARVNALAIALLSSADAAEPGERSTLLREAAREPRCRGCGAIEPHPSRFFARLDDGVIAFSLCARCFRSPLREVMPGARAIAGILR